MEEDDPAGEEDEELAAATETSGDAEDDGEEVAGVQHLNRAACNWSRRRSWAAIIHCVP